MKEEKKFYSDLNCIFSILQFKLILQYNTGFLHLIKKNKIKVNVLESINIV